MSQTSLLIHPRGIPWTSHFWSLWGDFRTNTWQIALAFVFLPHQAYLMCDAIVRTLYRKLFSRKRLLEWVSAAETEGQTRGDFGAFFSFMLPAEILTLLALGSTLALRPSALPVMGVLSAMWLESPVIAYSVSKRRAIDA
jgi:cyclic beta-1,2-glucan synthetase